MISCNQNFARIFTADFKHAIFMNKHKPIIYCSKSSAIKEACTKNV